MTSPAHRRELAPDELSPFARAFVARDFSTIRRMLADEISLYSPITPRFRFEGRAEVLRAMREARDAFVDFRYTRQASGELLEMIDFTARVRGRPLEGMDIVRVDDTGAVVEIKIFIRPLPSLAALAVDLGGRLTPRGSARNALIRILGAPLPHLMDVIDVLADRLVLRPFRRSLSSRR